MIGPYLENAKCRVSRLVSSFLRLVNYEFFKIVTVNLMNYTTPIWQFLTVGIKNFKSSEF